MQQTTDLPGVSTKGFTTITSGEKMLHN